MSLKNGYAKNRWLPGLVILKTGFIYFFYLYFEQTLTLNQALVESGLNMTMFLALTIALPYTAAYIEFKFTDIVRFVISHIIAASIINVALTIVYIAVLSFVSFNIGFEYSSSSTLIWRWMIWYFLYVVIQLINYLLQYYQTAMVREVQDSKMQSMLVEAELRNLRYQINPHFLFNSLNSIVSLISIDPENARKMLIRLSDFFRFSLKHEFNSTIPLTEEIEAVNNYLAIEKLRFGEKLILTLQISEDIKSTTLPALILQPVIENAIKHGVYQSLQPVALSISADRFGEYTRICITNDFEDDASEKPIGTGIGIANIKNRMQMLYGSPNLVTIEKLNNKFSVTLYIPYQEKI